MFPLLAVAKETTSNDSNPVLQEQQQQDQQQEQTEAATGQEAPVSAVEGSDDIDGPMGPAILDSQLQPPAEYSTSDEPVIPVVMDEKETEEPLMQDDSGTDITTDISFSSVPPPDHGTFTVSQTSLSEITYITGSQPQLVTSPPMPDSSEDKVSKELNTELSIDKSQTTPPLSLDTITPVPTSLADLTSAINSQLDDIHSPPPPVSSCEVSLAEDFNSELTECQSQASLSLLPTDLDTPTPSMANLSDLTSVCSNSQSQLHSFAPMLASSVTSLSQDVSQSTICQSQASLSLPPSSIGTDTPSLTSLTNITFMTNSQSHLYNPASMYGNSDISLTEDVSLCAKDGDASESDQSCPYPIDASSPLERSMEMSSLPAPPPPPLSHHSHKSHHHQLPPLMVDEKLSCSLQSLPTSFSPNTTPIAQNQLRFLGYNPMMVSITRVVVAVFTHCAIVTTRVHSFSCMHYSFILYSTPLLPFFLFTHLLLFSSLSLSLSLSTPHSFLPQSLSSTFLLIGVRSLTNKAHCSTTMCSHV